MKSEKDQNEILIVEDSPTQAEQLKFALEQYGYQVKTVINGREALKFLEKHKPFIVISDIVMPEMDGFDLCSTIKFDEKLKSIPVILLTSLSDPEDIVKGLLCMADNFIVKPYDEEYLISRIEYVKINKEIRKREQSQLGVEIFFAGQKHLITADRMQILDLLISTYETAVQKNRELEKAKEELAELNAKLEEKVKDRTAALSIEVEERKRAEERIRKINRIYHVTSNINQTIVRSRCEDDLFKEVCKIAVEIGKFKLAWIGLFDEKTKCVNVKSYRGIVDSPVSLSVKLEDEKNKDNTVAVAIETMEYSICNNIKSVHGTNPWEELAYKNDYHSVCSFPIIVFGKPYGTINLYSDQRNFFDEEEVSLLDEMAMDVSFCIETLINEEKRKKAEEAVFQAEEKYRDLVEHINDIIYSVDKNGVITYVSPAMEKILGYKPEEVTGKHMNYILKDFQTEEAAELFAQTLDGKLNMIEYIIYTKQGEPKWTRVSSSLMFENNEVVGIRGVLSDITEKKNAEQELIRAKENAEEMNRLKSNFLANMSHELRTPIIAILGFAEFLQNEIRNPEQLEFINYIIEGGQRLNNTLNSLLELSKLESAKLEPERSYCNVEKKLKEVISIVKDKVLKKNLSLSMNVNAKNLSAKIDESVFEKIMQHLLDNAVKFTNRGGITIILDKEIEDHTEWVKVSVSDTGVGISKESMENMFSSFRQISEGYNRSFEGLGIGLTITKKFIELFKGKILVESKLNSGSTFIILLPTTARDITFEKAIELQREPPFTESEIAVKKEKPKILHVEDNEATRIIIKKYLVKYYDIDQAEDGTTAIEKAAETKYDLILMDINLGYGIDGVEAMQKIRVLSGYADTPVIAVTAYVLAGDKEKFLEQGFNDYLGKPFTKDQLIQLAQNHLVNYRSRKNN